MTSIANDMLDQFQPWYFGVAFAFCFKYCTGMPDLVMFGTRGRDRRKEDKPQVDLQLWSKIITRRCENNLIEILGLRFQYIKFTLPPQVEYVEKSVCF